MASLKWYVLHSHPRKEETLYQYVLTRGVESFFPRIRVHPVNPRARKMLPYFPGYLFIRLDLSAIDYTTYQWMPHSTGLVTFGGEPAVVPDAIIETLHQNMDRLNQPEAKPQAGFQAGDELVIQSGPFAGYEAIFNIHLNGSERVQVLLKLLGQMRDVTVDLTVSQIKPRDS
jgi:transcription antitermination factor NusG